MNKLFGNSQKAVNIILKTLASSLLLAMTAAATAATDEQWQLANEDPRIFLYTRSIADSPFTAVKASMVVHGSSEKVASVFGDGNGCSEWRGMCKSSKLLGEPSETERYVYLVLDLPWPISDRDLVLHSVSELDAETKSLTVNLNSAEGKHPLTKHVRAKSNGSYVIRAVDEKNVEITYEMHVDLGGELSPGMINSRLVTSTFEDMERLLALVEN
ncbi:MAG: hypothetical protein ACI9JM_000619 [Halioglobus sp.]|jgi:hypothetical protein